MNRELLRHRRFRSLLLATLVDGSGTWAFNTVLAVIVFDRTGSVTWVGFALAARWLPGLLCGPFAGIPGDRHPRGRVMIASAVASAVVMAGAAVAIAVTAPVAVILVLAALQTAVASPYGPAASGVVPDLLPERHLAAANGLREVVTNLTIIAGPLLGGLFLLLGEPAVMAALNAAAFLVPAAVVWRLGLDTTRRPVGALDDDTAAAGSVLTELREGLHAVTSRRTALVLVIACALDSVVAGLDSVLMVPISVRVGTGSNGYAYLAIAVSVGAVLSAGLASRLANRPRLALIIAAALVAQAVPYALIVLVPYPVTAFGLVVVAGAGMMVVDVLAVTALQRDVPRRYLSRAFALLDTVVVGADVVAGPTAGALTQAVGLAPVLVAMGLGFPLLTLALLPLLRSADDATAARAAALAPVVALLRELDLFDGADTPELERLAIAANPVTVAAGDVVIGEGDPADALWLLAAGTLHVTSTRATAIPDVVAPSYVGELGLLHRRPRSATVTAATDASLYRIPGADFLAAVSGGDAVGASLTAVSAGRIARTPGAFA